MVEYKDTFQLTRGNHCGITDGVNNLFLDTLQAVEVLHIEQSVRGASNLRELQVMNLSNANGKHLNSQIPETVSCLLHIIMRLTISYLRMRKLLNTGQCL